MDLPSINELREFMKQSFQDDQDIESRIGDPIWDASFRILSSMTKRDITLLYRELVELCRLRFQRVVEELANPGILLQVKLDLCAKRFSYWRTVFHNVCAVFQLLNVKKDCDLVLLAYLTDCDHWLKPILTMTDHRVCFENKRPVKDTKYLFEYPVKIVSEIDLNAAHCI